MHVIARLVILRVGERMGSATQFIVHVCQRAWRGGGVIFGVLCCFYHVAAGLD